MDMLKIRALNDDDVQLMENWLNKEHIKKWYEVPDLCSIDDWLSEIKGRNNEFKYISHFIALWGQNPIGFCQYYKCEDIEDDWYGDTPLYGTYSIDYLIGEEAYLGKGLGKSIISLLVKVVFSFAKSERIIVQPDEDNKASCNSLLSNGFTFDTKNNIYILTK